MYLNPRMCGIVTYRGEILHGPDGKPVRGQWEPIMTDEEHNAILAKWGRTGNSRNRGSERRGAATEPFTCSPRSCGAAAAIAETLTAVIIKPAGKGQCFHPDQIVPVFRQEDDGAA